MKSLHLLYLNSRPVLERIREAFIDEDLEGPLLMELTSYYKQPIKLFIIGQETKGWCCNYKSHDILLSTYKNFNVGEKYYSSPFWNITRKVEDLIGIGRYSCAWSNINRYDHKGGEPKGEILNEIKKLDFLIAEEISVIKPDICLFFTNKKYDSRILRLYPGIEMERIDGLPFKHFVRLRHESLPQYSFRTPHPKTIRIQRWEGAFMDAMKKILPKITIA